MFSEQNSSDRKHRSNRRSRSRDYENKRSKYEPGSHRSGYKSSSNSEKPARISRFESSSSLKTFEKNFYKPNPDVLNRYFCKVFYFFTPLLSMSSTFSFLLMTIM